MSDATLPFRAPGPAPEVVDRYLAGESAPEETAEVTAWAGASQKGTPLAETVRDLLHELTPPATRSRIYRDTLWQRLSLPSESSPPHSPQQVPPLGRRQPSHLPNSIPRQWAALRIAAYVATASGLALLAVVGSHKIPTVLNESVGSPIKEYRTTAGQRARITLPDGSSMILAPMSHARYQATSGNASARTIILDGLAVFTVTHLGDTPFVVQTGDVATRVLGTTFSVRRYASDSAARVFVAQGRVSVGGTALGVGDVGVAKHTRAVSLVHGSDVAAELAWTEGRLVFSGTRLRDVIPEVERWYGITLSVTDPTLLDRLVTTTVGPQTASRAVEMIAFAVEGQATLRGNQATIAPH